MIATGDEAPVPPHARRRCTLMGEEVTSKLKFVPRQPFRP